MWGISNCLNPTMVGPPSMRRFSTHREVKEPTEQPKSTMLPYLDNIIQDISSNKKFDSPNQIKVNTSGKTGILYEKCSKFVNNSNGYPNNIRKDNIEGKESTLLDIVDAMGRANGAERISPSKSDPVDIMDEAENDIRTPKKGKKDKKVGRGVGRKKEHRNCNKNNMNTEMDYLDVDEVGLDACSFLSSSAESPCIFESLNFPNEYMVATHSEWKPTLDEFITHTRTTPIKSVSNLLKLTTSPIVVEIKAMSPSCFSVSPPFVPRRMERQPSICASEDSFIQFENVSCASDEEYESDDDEVEFDSSESEDSDDDFNESSSIMVDEVDACCCPKQKKVHFANDKDLVEVHTMHMWSFAYRASRKGHWEEYARDRERFQRRIACCTKDIEKILDLDHRLKVYQERFKTDEDKDTEV